MGVLGKFGRIEVRDTRDARSIYLNDQCQGGSFFHPPAAIVAQELGEDEPGPVATAAYAHGMLLAGVRSPVGSGVMVGLGSGAGAVGLLYNFPGIDLTVIEIDPQMTETALRRFPLLDHYMDRGRLQLVLADAQEYLGRRRDLWDFGIADGYTGGAELVDSYLPALCEVCDHVWLNVIDRLGGQSMCQTATILQQRGKPVRGVFKCLPSQAYALMPLESRSNWVLTDAEPDFRQALRFTPYADIEAPSAYEAQRAWDAMLVASEGLDAL